MLISKISVLPGNNPKVLNLKIDSSLNGVKLSYGMLNGTSTRIQPLNPRLKGKIVAAIPESSPKTQFSLTYMLDGTVADEFLKYDCDYLVINVAASTDLNTRVTTRKFSGLIIGLGVDNSVIVKSTLTHEECIALRTEKKGFVVSNYRYSDFADESRAQEDRRAQTIWLMENQVYL